MTTMTTPSATSLDYTDVDEICGYQLLLCKLYERAGGFDYDHRRTPRIVELRDQARIWLRHVRPLIDSRLNHIGDNDENAENDYNAVPRLLASYDLLYRICNGTPCFGYLRDIRLKLADRWVKGDRSITQTEIVLELLKEVARDNNTLDKRYSLYALTVKERWIRDLVMHDARFTMHNRLRASANNSTFNQSSNQPIPFKETYSRLAYLLKEDLFSFLGQRDQHRYKNEWIATYTLTDKEIDGLDTPTLRSYMAFVRNAAYYQRLPFDDIDAEYVHLLTKLVLRPDLHPYCRAALEMELAVNVEC